MLVRIYTTYWSLRKYTPSSSPLNTRHHNDNLRSEHGGDANHSREIIDGSGHVDRGTLLSGTTKTLEALPQVLLGMLILFGLVTGFYKPAAAASASSAPTLPPHSFHTNLLDYPDGQVPRFAMFELAFEIGDTTAVNPYFPYDPATPLGVTPATGITVDVLLLPPGKTDWGDAKTLPCFIYQPVEEVGSGGTAALLPVGQADWRCRFAPDISGTWRYRVRATDAGGTTESAEGQFTCVPSAKKGFIRVSESDSRFFEYADGTPFVTPLINTEQGNPFNSLAGIRDAIRKMGENGVRFVRWFPTGEGANYFVAPFGDTISINWGFGSSWSTAEGPDTAAGKLFSLKPYYYSSQTLPVVPGARYRMSLRASVTGDRVLRVQLGNLSGGTVDVCASTNAHHKAVGQTCTITQDGWHNYEVVVTIPSSGVSTLSVGVRGLYVSSDAPAPFNVVQDGSIRIHSIQFQRDETGNGDWGGNLLTRSDPDTHSYVDQRSAAKLDEIFRLSEAYGVYHKLPLFHKNDGILGMFQPDGTVGDWDNNNFYSDEGQAARWYEEAYVRYFVARWSYSTALHSLELGNENNFDGKAQASAFAIARVVRDTSPRHILMSNSFWGWWVESFWTHPEFGYLMDYSDKHWYANESGSYCNGDGEKCELISNVWDDSAAYVRECWTRFREYEAAYDYDKPIVRGEGGIAQSGTQPQHVAMAADFTGIYYHKKLWAHVGVLGATCDGEWYPNLSTAYVSAQKLNESYDLYGMFAAYERFTGSEPLSNGTYAEIGTDMGGSSGIDVSHLTGNLRAWGVQDVHTDRTLLWIDNAQHTWKRVVDGEEIQSTSAVLTLSGFEPGKAYTVQWWDPYATASAGKGIFTESLVVARTDGTLVLSVEGLERDVAVKVFSARTIRCYLPMAIRGTSG